MELCSHGHSMKARMAMTLHFHSWRSQIIPSIILQFHRAPIAVVCIILIYFLDILSHRGVALSLSPQPQYQEHGNPFDFDFATALPHEFPSTSMLSPVHIRATSSPSPGPSLKSSSPTPSCSSLDPTDIKISPSRGTSPLPLRTETDHRRRFPCLIIGCERRFTSQYTLKVHMEAHKPKPRSSFPCTLGCSEKFSRQHDRLRHEVAKHGKICEFSCEDCGRFFSTRKTLSNHKCPLANGGTRWVTN